MSNFYSIVSTFKDDQRDSFYIKKQPPVITFQWDGAM